MKELRLVKKIINPKERETVNAPPTKAEVGMTFSIGSNPVGDWEDHAGEIATWVGSWMFREREPLNSFDMVQTAIEENKTNRVGILRMRKVGRILEKLEQAVKDGVDHILLETEEMDVIYESVDKCEWTPIPLHFREFFEEIEEAKKREVKVEKVPIKEETKEALKEVRLV